LKVPVGGDGEYSGAEYLRPVPVVDGVAACDDFCLGIDDHSDCGAPLLHWVVLELQHILERQPSDLALALDTLGLAARGCCRFPTAMTSGWR